MGRPQTKEKRHREPGPCTGAQWAGRLRVMCGPKTLCRGQGRAATLLGRDDAARTVTECATAFPRLPSAVLGKTHLLPQKQRFRTAWPSGRKPWSELCTLGGMVCRCKFITRDKHATRRGANNVGEHARVREARSRKSPFFWEPNCSKKYGAFKKIYRYKKNTRDFTWIKMVTLSCQRLCVSEKVFYCIQVKTLLWQIPSPFLRLDPLLEDHHQKKRVCYNQHNYNIYFGSSFYCCY